MSMIEIDPLLFIKCRLCLEESGIYQIVPAVREQITYCFGINVEPFDGLPQLICKKCQLVLCEYSEKKQTFIEKQEGLKRKKPQNNLTPPVVKAETGASKCSSENSDTVKENKRRKRKRLFSSSSNESNSTHATVYEEDITNTSSKEDNVGWKAKYQKIFSCRLCNASWSSWKSASCHKKYHGALRSRHVDVFNKYCIVELPKIDDKPNITGTTDKVVYSKNKIIAMGSRDFYIAYKYKGKSKENTDNESINSEKHNNEDEYSDSSYQSNKRLSHRRVRQISSSSNETVVLENNTNERKTDECISIEDSDSPVEKIANKRKGKRKVSRQTNKIDVAEATNMVNKLISMSHLKYVKRHELLDKSTLLQLNRKITSIGRQIINKKGFNTNRLMKYLEHLNLNIIWLARSPVSVTNSSHYFKIIPRMRYPNEKSCNDFEGFKKKYDKGDTSNREMEESEAKSMFGRKKGPSAVTTENGSAVVSVVKRKLVAEVSVSSTGNTDVFSEHDSSLNCKLLNENPVANPKQLKKFYSEAKKSKLVANIMPTLEINPAELSSEVMSNYENNMPVISYTRSLANNTAENINNPTETSKVTSTNESSKPRIKVKSVTELMSKETLSRMKEPASVLTPNLLNGAGHTGFASPQKAIVSNLELNSDEYVILDTVELPNTKTSSPFSYFRMLLQVHNLSLLDTEAILSADFHSLIRFKVRYNHENKEQPVILCLSLLCSNNIFCIKIKDRNEENINISKISANWQWEILKIYKGDVVSKVLTNAEKISPAVYLYTNRFVCLLKSINYLPK